MNCVVCVDAERLPILGTIGNYIDSTKMIVLYFHSRYIKLNIWELNYDDIALETESLFGARKFGSGI